MSEFRPVTDVTLPQLDAQAVSHNMMLSAATDVTEIFLAWSASRGAGVPVLSLKPESARHLVGQIDLLEGTGFRFSDAMGAFPDQISDLRRDLLTRLDDPA